MRAWEIILKLSHTQIFSSKFQSFEPEDIYKRNDDLYISNKLSLTFIVLIWKVAVDGSNKYVNPEPQAVWNDLASTRSLTLFVF